MPIFLGNPLNTPALEPGTSDGLSLTDFIDPDTLQDLQDSFTSFARLSMRVLDRSGEPVTQPTDLPKRAQADQTFEQLTIAEREPDGSLRAPISIGGHELGSILVTPHQIEPDHGITDEQRERLDAICIKLGLGHEDREALLTAAESAYTATTGASLGFIHQIAPGQFTHVVSAEIRKSVERAAAVHDEQGGIASRTRAKGARCDVCGDRNGRPVAGHRSFRECRARAWLRLKSGPDARVDPRPGQPVHR